MLFQISIPRFPRLAFLLLTSYFLLLLPLPLFAQSAEEAEELTAQGRALHEQGKSLEAISLLNRALEIREKDLDPQHPDTAQSLNNLAIVYFAMGNNIKALPLHQRALAIREKALGPQHPDTAASLNNLANVYRDNGDNDKALPLYERALSIWEKVLTPQHPNTATSLNNLALIYEEIGDYSQAQRFHERSLAIREKALGPQHPDTAASLNSLAKVYHTMGNSDKAIPLLERALAIRENTFGPMHPNTASSLKNLANLYSNVGDTHKAMRLYARALEIEEKALGPHHPRTANSLTNLASHCKSMGDNTKALKLYERALAIREKVLGPEHPDTASSLNNLASIYFRLGDYANALSLFDRAMVINKKVLGPEHPNTSMSLNNMAMSFQSIGDFEKALPLMEQALELRKKNLGKEHKSTVESFNNLAALYNFMGDYQKALPLFESVLAISEQKYGPENPVTAVSLSNLAALYNSMGNNLKALQLYERALVIFEKSLGKDHLNTGVCLHNLSNLYQSMADNAKSLSLAACALEVYEKWLGIEHPVTSNIVKHVAIINYLLDNSKIAQTLALKHLKSTQREVQIILTLDERSRLAWQKKNLSHWSACVIPPQAIAQSLLSNKGVVLDSLAEDRALALAAGGSSSGANILQQIKSLQSRLSKIAFEQGNETEATNLQDEIGRLQRELAAKYLGRDRQRTSATLTIADIIPALAGGGVLLDFIEFEDPKLKGEEATCLGVIITGEDNNSIFVRIDGGIAINRSIEALRASITQNNESDVEAQTKFLSEKLWAPIAAKIPEGTKRLFLCPDSNLNFLSFAALLESDGRFVAEKYPITYIGSARDLAKKPSNKTSKSMALIANPQFDANVKNAISTEQFAMRSAEADVFGSIALPPLPGTETEAAALEALASQSGWQTKSYLGVDATEPSVRNIQRPGVLHLATHGFYLNSFIPPGSEASRGMSVVGVKETAEEKKKMEHGVDPMRASGVALTGAQQTLASWSQRKAPDPQNDGILTAEEVAALDLDGTWLVTLSACETGVGEARSGEGVFGLRRAFMIAGAENLVMTLWPVADDTTAKIMTDFYQEALATGDAPGSLAKVQRDWLVKLRKDRGLATAIRDAGPFALVAMTAPRTANFQLPDQPNLPTPSKPKTQFLR